ncbi:SseB family protein [Paracoccus jeotgali]|uniref:SseB family protein n=1 Tax=Paracoccus jeotgali TaxID=2065379 RepID=UPI0028AC58B8|nr:SseB family protein [Paracoccus jeotgali]
MTPLDALCPAPFHELPDADRARVLNRLADTTLFVALDDDPQGDRARLLMLGAAEARTALAADEPERLADFLSAPTAHAELPGRVLAAMLAAEGAALMVNPGAPSQMLLDAGMLGWLSQALSAQPEATEAAQARLSAPALPVVAALADPLAARLADMAGLVEGLGIVGADWGHDASGQGERGHLLVVLGAPPDQQPRIAKALAEMLAFLPPLPDRCDVAFDLKLPPEAVVLRPQPSAPQPEPEPRKTPRAPGSDPDKPPILRF